MISNSAQRHVTALGTTRLVTDATGAVAECHDYLPFGEEIGNDDSDGCLCFEHSVRSAECGEFDNAGDDADRVDGDDYV